MNGIITWFKSGPTFLLHKWIFQLSIRSALSGNALKWSFNSKLNFDQKWSFSPKRNFNPQMKFQPKTKSCCSEAGIWLSSSMACLEIWNTLCVWNSQKQYFQKMYSFFRRSYIFVWILSLIANSPFAVEIFMGGHLSGG